MKFWYFAEFWISFGQQSRCSTRMLVEIHNMSCSALIGFLNCCCKSFFVHSVSHSLTLNFRFWVIEKPSGKFKKSIHYLTFQIFPSQFTFKIKRKKERNKNVILTVLNSDQIHFFFDKSFSISIFQRVLSRFCFKQAMLSLQGMVEFLAEVFIYQGKA